MVEVQLRTVLGTLPTSGTEDITVAGLGTPAGMILKAFHTTSDGSISAGAAMSITFVDDDLAMKSVTMSDEDGTAAANSDRRMSDGTGVLLTDSGGLAAEFTATEITDGYRLTFTTHPGSAFRYVATVLYGDNAKSEVWELGEPSSNNGTLTFNFSRLTSVDLSAQCRHGYLPEGSTIGIGMMIYSMAFDGGSGIENVGSRYASWNGSANGDPRSSIGPVVDVNFGSTTSNRIHYVSALGGSSITVKTELSSGSGDPSRPIYGLAMDLDGASVDAGEYTTPTATGVQTTTVGFEPGYVEICVSKMQTWQGLGDGFLSNGDAGTMWWGCADGTEEAGGGMQTEDGAATMNTSVLFTGSKILDMPDDDGSTGFQVATWDTPTSTAFKLNFTTADSTARKGWYLAVAAPAASDTDVAVPAVSAALSIQAPGAIDQTVDVPVMGSAASSVQAPSVSTTFPISGIDVPSIAAALSIVAPAAIDQTVNVPVVGSIAAYAFEDPGDAWVYTVKINRTVPAPPPISASLAIVSPSINVEQRVDVGAIAASLSIVAPSAIDQTVNVPVVGSASVSSISPAALDRTLSVPTVSMTAAIVAPGVTQGAGQVSVDPIAAALSILAPASIAQTTDVGAIAIAASVVAPGAIDQTVNVPVVGSAAASVVAPASIDQGDIVNVPAIAALLAVVAPAAINQTLNVPVVGSASLTMQPPSTGTPQRNTELAGTSTSRNTALAGTATSRLTAITNMTTTNANFPEAIMRGADVVQPFTVTLDQLRVLDGSETWALYIRRKKNGALLADLSSQIVKSIDASRLHQPECVFLSTSLTEANFPDSEHVIDYWFDLRMLKDSKYEFPLQGKIPVLTPVTH